VSPTPGTPRSVADRATAARRALDPDGTATTVLRALRAETAEMLSYDALSDELGLSANNRRQVALKLDRKFELAERVDMPGGERGLSLRPAGNVYLDAVDSETGRQQHLSVFESGSVTSPQNPSEYSRVTPHAHEGEPDDGTDQPADNRPTNEGVAITATRNRPRGYVQSVYLDWPSHDGARLAADPSEIALVDAPTTELKRRDGQEDFRAMGWSYDEDNSDLVVAAKYTNPMQYWTCIGRALTSTWTWDRVLTEDVLADIFSKYSLRILRDARNIGGLSEERYDDPAAFIEYYQQQEQRLCDLTREWYHGDYDDANKMRSEITRLAKGLSGSIAQLLDLADIGLVREVRLPEFSRNWSDKQRRQTLVRTLAHSCSIESLYGHFVAYRQLYEQRDRHRKAAIDPEVDACDPLGELVGSLVVVGPGVPDLENELRSALRSPGELHDDAPEIAVQIPIRASTSRSVIARTVRRMCDRKGIEATREAVSLFEGFVTTSYDVARAIHYGLEQEDRRQEIHIDEVRRALAHLDPGRLLANADVKPTMQKALSVLLGTDRPLSGAAIAHRAGITTESFRKNRTEFVVADLLREVPEGWRLSLSFADERYGRDVLPWFFIDDPDNRPYFSSLDLRVTRDVLYEFLISIVDDPARFGDPDDVLYRAFVGRSDRWARGLDGLCDEWPWLRSILPLVRAACESPEDSGMDPVLMGPTPSQQPFTTVSNKTVG
ncbi:MAG: hypothetical protein IH933_16070, partial [Euryarchaeota archaeon]|nr:hypothetical protein [Euryarchaeota archaeon]